MRRKVLMRDIDYTEMVVRNSGEATGLARQLIRKGKPFVACPSEEDGTWTFTIYEYNIPTRWEDA